MSFGVRIRCSSRTPFLSAMTPWGLLLGSSAEAMLPLLAMAPGPSGVLSGVTTGAPLAADVATAALRHASLIILVALHLYVVGVGGADAGGQTSSAEGLGNCSKMLGFNESAGGPKDRGKQDLAFCQEHDMRTCCEKNHTRQALAQYALFAHDRSTMCSQISRIALCSICDGDVGSGVKARDNAVLLCPSFCARWFQACIADFFAPGETVGSLRPCAPGHVVCSPLREIFSDPAKFCEGVAAVSGFAVASSEAEDADECFDGVPAAKYRGKGPRNPWTRPVSWRGPMPFWRRFFGPDGRLQFPRLDGLELPPLPKSIEPYLPGVVVAFVVVMIGWYVFRLD